MTAKMQSKVPGAAWIGQLGHLRPWEIIDISEQLAEQTGIEQLVQLVAEHLKVRIREVRSFHDIEEIVLIAADVRAIFSQDIKKFQAYRSGDAGWSLFLRALNGATFQELEETRETRVTLSESQVPRTTELAASLVSSYVTHNPVVSTDIPRLITDVHSALLQANSGSIGMHIGAPTPSISVKKSVTADYVICLEDGKKFKSLKRHLRTHYNMTPEQYRKKWGLPEDYPMVAPNYAKARSELAKEMGLGQRRKRRSGKRKRSA